MKQKKTFGTGDINLASAILTMGVAPDLIRPVELIARDNGNNYIRFHFESESACGQYTPDELSHAWMRPGEFKAENPNHPFGCLMDFIFSRPQGCTCADDWQAHAAQFLGLPIDAIRKTYQSIGKVCMASPDSPVSYVCAYVRNRIDLISACKVRQSTGTFTNMQDRTKTISMIPAKAPKRIRDFLLSHIR